MTARIRVLVVDDSSIARRFITARLERDPELDVVGTASDGSAALELIDADPPDVVILDETMPGMTGREVLRVLRKQHPEVAVVMFSASVGEGTMARFEALYLGADDAVSKPRATDNKPVGYDHPTWTELLTKAKKSARRHERGGVSLDVARDAGRTRLAPPPESRRPGAARPAPVPPTPPAGRSRLAGGGTRDVAPVEPAAEAPVAPPAARSGPGPSTPEARAERRDRRQRQQPPVPAPTPRTPPPARGTATPPGASSDAGAVIIASSTGGPDALGQVFSMLPADFPLPILIAQHMPADFTRLLAERLDSKSAVTVTEAQGGEPLLPGCAYVAPGDFHLVVDTRGPTSVTRLTTAPPENSCRPAADVLFRSAVAAYGKRLVAVVLSGMGRDGADGCGHVKHAGGHVICQDEATSVVWGMPGATVKDGWADVVLPIDRIAAETTERARALALRSPAPRRKALR